jgi:hypothetical protein
MEASASAGLEASPGDGDAVDTMDPDLESDALKTARWCRGLLAGRTLVQLGSEAAIEVQDAFRDTDRTELKLKFILTELGMIYDMLYTKAMVLQSWTGVFRCVGLVAMVVAFVLFWVNQHLHAHRTTNAAITYTLFVAAIYMEVYSIFMVIMSPWTRARSKQVKFLYWLSSNHLSFQRLPIPSMGQFNLVDYCLSKKSAAKFIPKVSEALGLEKHRRNFLHVKHLEDEVILKYIVELFNTDPNYSDERGQLDFDNNLKYLLKLPFEHTLFRMHIYTEMLLSTLNDSDGDNIKVPAAECRKLSNYLMYLMAVYPSMLPVGGATQDLESLLVEWIRKNHGDFAKIKILKNETSREETPRLSIKTAILQKYAKDKLSENDISSPLKEASPESLKDLKEVWARLLIYAAGKCRMELHARQLGEGMELLTVVGTLMMHHNIGDVGRKLELLAPRRVHTQEATAVVHESEEMDVVLPEEPLYAFEFFQPSPPDKWYVLAWDRQNTNRAQQTHDIDTPTSRQVSTFTNSY